MFTPASSSSSLVMPLAIAATIDACSSAFSDSFVITTGLFDEEIERLQDWDLWLTMLDEGKSGVYCGEIIFDTERKNGISQNGKIDLETAINIIKAKHLL